MKGLKRRTKIILFDTLGVLCIIAAPLTGWLPGPGGIPLAILGLSLLAVHHEWADRYIKILRAHADRLGDMIFVKNPAVQIAYDILAPMLVLSGGVLLWQRPHILATSAGGLMLIFGLVIFMGNRGRYVWLKQHLRRLIRKRA